MAYRALYRKYRPAAFSEIVGQEHITTTLQNQIATGHVAHAYLFCGTRGTGKTSTAKIFARAVNCLAPDHGEPCCQCEACRLALDPGNPDITEIDAASNNGVDDIRALIEKAHYAPLQLQTRVFIIDEVHMLSTSAFNALLKTLEEPPAHILFILATTEPQKLPATIISRCQRFDFHRLSVRDIVSTLKSVLDRAGASIDEEGLLLIARTADGGMRDALSLADQCLAFCGDAVSARDVYDVLGSMEQSFLFEIADALLAADAGKALHMLDGIVRGGRDLTVFCQDLAAHLRALLLAGTCGRCEDLLDCTADAMDRYLEQAGKTSSARLLLAMETLLRVQGEMRYLSTPRAALESALVRICRPEDDRSIAALEARIDRLERERNGLEQRAAAPAAVQPAASPICEQRESPPVQAAERPAVATAQPVAARAKSAAAPAQEQPAASAPAPAASPVCEQRESPPVQAAEQPAVATAQPVAARANSAAAPAQEQPASAAQGVTDGAFATAEALWGAALDELRKQNILIHAMAVSGVAQQLTDDALTVAFPESRATQYNSMCAPVNHTKIQSIVAALRPGTTVTFVKAQPRPLPPETEARARELFGDKLVIE